MRFVNVAVTVGLAAAMVFAGAGSASSKPSAKQDGVGVQRTGGDSFLEVNAAGELVRWTRAGGTFDRQVRGTNWQNTLAITSLDDNSFLEIKPDYRLAKWTWNGAWYVERIVGQGWDNAQTIAGIASGAFLEVNHSSELKRWWFDQSGNLVSELLRTDFPLTTALAGMSYVSFIEVEDLDPARLSEWTDFTSEGRNLTETRFPGDFSQGRLIAGLKHGHFLVVQRNGELREYVRDVTGYYGSDLRGWGWQGTRLIG